MNKEDKENILHKLEQLAEELDTCRDNCRWIESDAERIYEKTEDVSSDLLKTYTKIKMIKEHLRNLIEADKE